jgi:uncharacterized membrane protein
MTTDDAPSAPAPSDASSPPSPGPAADAAPSPSPGAESPTSAPSFLERLPWWAVPAVLVGVPLLLALVAKAVPAFYDHVVWPYYWGPIKADAMNCAYLSNLAPERCAFSASSPGVVAHSGYNVVNTLTWAVLLGVCILGLAQMLTVFRTPMDSKLIVAATAWVVVGSVTHVLEDTGLFAGALQYLFITPPIYLMFGAFGVLSFLVGQWMRSVAAKADLHAALRVLWLVHAILVVVWLGLWLKGWPGITHYVHPAWVALFAVANFLAARTVVLRQGRVDPSLLTMVLSLGTYLLVFAYVLSYVQHPWPDSSGVLHHPDDGMPTAWLIAPALALALTGLVYLVARKAPKALLGALLVGGPLLAGIAVLTVALRLFGRIGPGIAERLEAPIAAGFVVLAVAAYVAWRTWQDNKGKGDALAAQTAVAFAMGINLLLVFAQMLDAFATALGIDLNGYTEKHVLSAGVIDAFRGFADSIGWSFGAQHPTFLAFAPVKLVVSLLVVWAIDVYSAEDSRRHPTMIGLVKFAIIMVGIGPGVRDFTRLSLGV